MGVPFGVLWNSQRAWFSGMRTQPWLCAHAEGFPGVLLPGGGVEADGLVRAHTLRERHPGNGVITSIHRGGSVLRINLAVEDRCWRLGFAGADRDHANNLLIAVLDGQALVGEVDHKAGDELDHGEGTAELALAVSVKTHWSRSEKFRFSRCFMASL